MAWVLLILGVALFWAAHLVRRLAPELSAKLGDGPRKGIVTAIIVLGIVLMVIGYRGTPYIHVWDGPSFLRHINNLLVLVSFYLASPAPTKGALLYKMRHPMLTGFAVFLIAHLMVNGDVASIILFGGLLAWVPVGIMLINRAESWSTPERGDIKWDFRGLGGAAILVGIIGYIHGLLGPSPFGG